MGVFPDETTLIADGEPNSVRERSFGLEVDLYSEILPESDIESPTLTDARIVAEVV